MTREEKIELLNRLLEIEEKNDIGNLTRAERGEFQQWVNDAFEPCEDAISREAVLDLCDSKDAEYKVKHFKEDVECLPSVYPKPKTGHWIEQDNGNMLSYHRYKCSVCGGKRTGDTGDWIQIHDCKWKYCPDCGARMNEEVEE